MSPPRAGGADRWPLVVSTATMGLARTGLPAEGLWPHPSLASQEAAPGALLLRAAAANVAWRLAGRRVASSGRPRREAPEVQASTVSAPAAWRLGRMLGGTRAELIGEWFACARDRGLVLPSHWLPPVLDALPPAMRHTYSAVLGPRAEWLASQNPAWAATALPEPTDGAWTGGTLDQRKAMLERERQTSPGNARRWVEMTWGEDPPEARAAFIGILRTGLGIDDEPLLERALADGRKSVRAAAVECLVRLPGSAHAARTLARVRSLVQLQPARRGPIGAFVSRTLEVTLPAALDAATVRDGVESKAPAGRKVGERVWWLMQMVAMTPPASWVVETDCSPDVVLDAALATEYGQELLEAFTTAATRNPDAGWMASLCRRWASSTAGDVQSRAARLAALVDGAPADARNAILQEVIGRCGAAGFETVLAVLSHADAVWNGDTTTLAFDALAARSRNDGQTWQHPRTLLSAWGRRADVDTAVRDLPRVTGGLPPGSPWRAAVEELADVVDFRFEMRRELACD